MTDVTADLPQGEPRITRDEADLMALRFLADNGPHTMGPIEDESALAAAMIFLDLEKAGAVHRTILTHGWLQFAITERGREIVSAAGGLTSV